MLHTAPTPAARGIDRVSHAQRLGGPYQRRIDRHALGPPVHGQHGRREPLVDAVGAAMVGLVAIMATPKCSLFNTPHTHESVRC